MAKLMISREHVHRSASGNRIGGVPLAPDGTGWPTCRECKGAMQFLAQLSLSDGGITALANRHILLFQCQNDPGMCDEWDPDSGGNAALLVRSRGAGPLAPPSGPTTLDWVDGVELVDHPSDYDTARAAETRTVLGQLGGSPSWAQADETPRCDCGKSMTFAVQLEEVGGGGINFGGGGCAYGFVCTACGDRAKLLWQC